MTLPNILEGTWRELSKLAPQFGDRRLRLTILPATSLTLKPTDEDVRLANEALLNCSVDIGYSMGVENEQIDIDLAREYADDHSKNRLLMEIGIFKPMSYLLSKTQVGPSFKISLFSKLSRFVFGGRFPEGKKGNRGKDSES